MLLLEGFEAYRSIFNLCLGHLRIWRPSLLSRLGAIALRVEAIAMIKSKEQITLLRMIPTMTFQNSPVDIALVVYFSPEHK